jgi:hypothetical protein
VLKAGSVEAAGQLEELLETCVEMRQLWQGDVDSDETAETTAPGEPTQPAL